MFNRFCNFHVYTTNWHQSALHSASIVFFGESPISESHMSWEYLILRQTACNKTILSSHIDDLPFRLVQVHTAAQWIEIFHSSINGAAGILINLSAISLGINKVWCSFWTKKHVWWGIIIVIMVSFRLPIDE